jgi:sigma54-dependent transcription regulator
MDCHRRVIHLLPTPVLTGSGSTGSPAAPTSQAFARPPQGKIRKSSANCAGFASRELSASITRMATLADGGRITERLVDDEIARLKMNWTEVHNGDLSDLLTADQLTQMDTFDRLTTAVSYRSLPAEQVNSGCGESTVWHESRSAAPSMIQIDRGSFCSGLG